MKKILLSFLPAMLLFALTGCLKDKDFDDQKYGLHNPDSKAVGFIEAPAGPLVRGITGQSATVTVNGPVITINGTNKPASSNITIHLIEDASLVTAAGFTPLPQGTYNINTTSPSIASGDSLTDELEIAVTGSDNLNPDLTYGVGYRIEKVEGNYDISRNMSTIVIGFTIKNKYDGVYNLQGYHNRAPYNFPYNTEIHLVTVAPDAVAFYWPEENDYGHPIGVGANNSMSWYGTDIQPVIVFDRQTDLATDVRNRSSAVGITLFTGTGSRTSRFDASTRNITVDWNYGNNAMRAFFDDLTFVRDR